MAASAEASPLFTGGFLPPLSAGSTDPANSFDCRATALTLGGDNPIGPTVANEQYHPCEEEETQGLLLPPPPDPMEPDYEPQIAIRPLYARTEMRKNFWAQSYSSAAVVQLGAPSGPHILVETLESSATVACVKGQPRLATNGGVADVHIRTGEDEERETIVNVGNGYDYIRIPGLGALELNKTEKTENGIQRTALVLTDEHDDDPSKHMPVVEIAKTEAGYTGNPCAR